MMLLSGTPIDAETALRVGLAAEICDVADTVKRAVEIAGVIATRAPLAVQETKALIKASQNTSLDAGIAAEREALWRIIESSDRYEGMSAFLEKRAPRFTGRW
jgi:enoyl-CoA hydratase